MSLLPQAFRIILELYFVKAFERHQLTNAPGNY